MSAFTNQLKKGAVLKIPIGHMEGNYFMHEPEELKRLESEDRIVHFATRRRAGEITQEANPKRIRSVTLLEF